MTSFQGAGVSKRIADGLIRISTALRSRAWRQAGKRQLTPTQGQLLVLLAQSSAGMRLSALSEALGIKVPTASQAVSRLERKNLVTKTRSEEDGRAYLITLTEDGRREALDASQWSDVLATAIDTLDEDEQAVLLRVVAKIVGFFGETGQMPAARMCVSCAHFRPFVNEEKAQPHSCQFLELALDERALRIECAYHARARGDRLEDNWNRFLQVAPLDTE